MEANQRYLPTYSTHYHLREVITMGVQRRTAPKADDYAAPARDDEPDAGLTDENENDETPRSSSVARKGWGAAKAAAKKASKGFENEFKVAEEDQVVKHVEEEPFWSGAVHWVDEIKDGKRSFYCIDEVDAEGCPLCGVGHECRAQIWFNVVPVSNEEGATKPEMCVLKASPTLSSLIEKEHDGRYGPLTRHFWKYSKTGGGKKGKVNYSLAVVKATDLAGDWEVNPDEVATAIKDLKPYTDEIVKYPSRSDLEEIVNEHLLKD